MTSRERLLALLHREMPDCVPCCPDISNMVPCRLTGKPFWDIYVFQDPPLWKAHIAALKYFDIDGGFELYDKPSNYGKVVARRPDKSFVTQRRDERTGAWSRHVCVHTVDMPPAYNVLPESIGLPAEPAAWEEIEGIKPWPTGLDLWRLMRQEMGDQGVVGMGVGATTCMLSCPEDVYQYHEDPGPLYERRERMLDEVERRFREIAVMDVKPDFVECGGSGSLVWQSPAIFRDLALPVLQRVTELAADMGIPSHVHSCGPEKELVRMAAEETQLTVIDPLEVPPMGDCDLAELKRRYGSRIVLKGNLHTTEVMLRGSAAGVAAASRKAIDDAGAGGGFILSTGDQCGRDTPDANIRAMVQTARTHGRY